MTPPTTLGGRVGPLTQLHWHHPEWPVYVVAQFGWLVMLVPLVGNPGLMTHGSAHPGVIGLAIGAVAMSCAMMAPLVLDRCHHLAVSSLWTRRYRAIGAYLVGYLGVWAVVGCAMVGIGHLAASVFGRIPVVATAALVAIGVASGDGHRRRLARCSATRPLALSGWRADRDCVVAGVAMAGRCVATSWALMLLAMVQHGLIVAVLAAAVVLGERRGPLTHRSAWWCTVGVGILATVLTLSAYGAGIGALPQPHGGH
ncbi:DUF2182 domain-containing protein [Gordonia sp. ABSL1-1]|uniref:copper chaperone n=1 Tax=Gordonia sp. ABSL1-1 TaxID=3053923 RepID=UPI00257261A5|nr:DUF2182 domain-containing protein [Gordonia sp. ABSL1-1]MDL9938659.1 DUF2182 domain-containing protein [Gordonia sp. ABSL1-1]